MNATPLQGSDDINAKATVTKNSINNYLNLIHKLDNGNHFCVHKSTDASSSFK